MAGRRLSSNDVSVVIALAIVVLVLPLIFIDPAKAEPWLAVAREAKGRNDAAGLDDAMFHVAASPASASSWAGHPSGSHPSSRNATRRRRCACARNRTRTSC